MTNCTIPHIPPGHLSAITDCACHAAQTLALCRSIRDPLAGEQCATLPHATPLWHAPKTGRFAKYGGALGHQFIGATSPSRWRAVDIVLPMTTDRVGRRIGPHPLPLSHGARGRWASEVALGEHGGAREASASGSGSGSASGSPRLWERGRGVRSAHLASLYRSSTSGSLRSML